MIPKQSLKNFINKKSVLIEVKEYFINEDVEKNRLLIYHTMI